MASISSLNKPPVERAAKPKGPDFDKMPHFSISDQLLLERIAGALSDKEVADYLGFKLTSLNMVEVEFFDMCLAKGRAKSKSQAVEKLFKQMNGQKGVAACLAYLTANADNWKGQDPGQGDSIGRVIVDISGT